MVRFQYATFILTLCAVPTACLAMLAPRNVARVPSRCVLVMADARVGDGAAEADDGGAAEAGDGGAAEAGHGAPEAGDGAEAQLWKRRRGRFKPYKPKDNRDTLLYDVTEMTPPPSHLGTFRLEPGAACGDMISLVGATQAYVIKKVSYRYEYGSGGYKMVGKRVSVKRASREGVEKFLQRMLPRGEAEQGPLDGALPPPRPADADEGVA